MTRMPNASALSWMCETSSGDLCSGIVGALMSSGGKPCPAGRLTTSCRAVRNAANDHSLDPSGKRRCSLHKSVTDDALFSLYVLFSTVCLFLTVLPALRTEFRTLVPMVQVTRSLPVEYERRGSSS